VIEGLAAMTNQSGALQLAFSAVQADTTTIKGETTAARSDLMALKDSVGTALPTQLTGVQSSLGTPPSGHSLYSAFMASRRYSRTCEPTRDTWLRSAWPGMSDVEIKDACLRDGRWHYLGNMRDYITGTIAFPEGMQIGLTTYAESITPVTVNEWNKGIRLCLPVLAVGDVHMAESAALVHECIAVMDGKFTVTHKFVDQASAGFSQRDYGGYTDGEETALPCTETRNGGWAHCSNTESLAGHWNIYIRQ